MAAEAIVGPSGVCAQGAVDKRIPLAFGGTVIHLSPERAAGPSPTCHR